MCVDVLQKTNKEASLVLLPEASLLLNISMSRENHTPSTMDLSNHKHNPASSSSSSSNSTSGANGTVPMSQDFPSVNSQARVTHELLGFSTNGNDLDCPFSELYPIIVYANEDGYFVDNDLTDMFKDAPLIQQTRSQENSQNEHQDSDTKQGFGLEYSSSENISALLRSSSSSSSSSENISSRTPPEIFGHSQQLNNQSSSSPSNKRNDTPDCSRNTMMRENNILSHNPSAFASNNKFNVNNQGPSSSVNPRRGCRCIKTSCSYGRCPCYQAKVGCCSKSCVCLECENSYGRRN